MSVVTDNYRTVHSYSIMGQRLKLEVPFMLDRLKKIVTTLIIILIAIIVTGNFFGVPKLPDFSLVLLVFLGATLVLLGLLTALERRSALSLGVINRAEFYGVVVVILGAFFYMNTRIDTLFAACSQIR